MRRFERQRVLKARLTATLRPLASSTLPSHHAPVWCHHGSVSVAVLIANRNDVISPWRCLTNGS